VNLSRTNKTSKSGIPGLYFTNNDVLSQSESICLLCVKRKELCKQQIDEIKNFRLQLKSSLLVLKTKIFVFFITEAQFMLIEHYETIKSEFVLV
jgi:hypothetical protein